MYDSKSILASKTFWFNLLAGLVAFLAVINQDFLTQLGIDPKKQHTVMAITGLVVAAINMVLRQLTTQPTTLSITSQSDNQPKP